MEIHTAISFYSLISDNDENQKKFRKQEIFPNDCHGEKKKKKKSDRRQERNKQPLLNRGRLLRICVTVAVRRPGDGGGSGCCEAQGTAMTERAAACKIWFTGEQNPPKLLATLPS